MKPTLMQLRERHGINLYAMWDASGLEDSLPVYLALFKHPITREQAQRIIEGINHIAGTEYTLETVDIVLAE